MHDHSKLDAFGKDRAKSYDQSNTFMAPINANLHHLIKIILSELAPHSKILCVGAGTGTEIIELAEAFPQFTFVAVEPSASMLEVCREKLQKLNLLDRCKLIHGYVQDLPGEDEFDAALCLLVLHHTSKDERPKIIAAIARLLKPQGSFITAELSYDSSSRTSDDMMKKWQVMSRRSGSPEEKVQSLPKMMKEHLSIQSPSEVESMLETNGFATPLQFFQSLLVRAWCAQKKRP
ncbi:ubiquinone/menaquinone biosynthesis methyltransferase [compost metagenome]